MVFRDFDIDAVATMDLDDVDRRRISSISSCVRRMDLVWAMTPNSSRLQAGSRPAPKSLRAVATPKTSWYLRSESPPRA